MPLVIFPAPSAHLSIHQRANPFSPLPPAPPPAIYFVPSDAPDPAAYCEALKQQLAPPPLMPRDLMLPAKDPMFIKFYVLLHDSAAPSADEARCALRVYFMA